MLFPIETRTTGVVGNYLHQRQARRFRACRVNNVTIAQIAAHLVFNVVDVTSCNRPVDPKPPIEVTLEAITIKIRGEK
jgi:hypothetical protein